MHWILLFIRITLCLRNNLASVISQKSLNLLESPTSSSMALVFNNTQAWTYLILRKPTIQYVSMASFTNLSHCACPIIPFYSLSPAWKVLPLLSTWMTLNSPQNPVLRSSSGCRTIDTILPLPFRHPAPSAHPPPLYANDTAILSQSWRRDTISRRLCHAVTTLLKHLTTRKLPVHTHKTETKLFSKIPPPSLRPASRTLFKSMTTLCPVPRR